MRRRCWRHFAGFRCLCGSGHSTAKSQARCSCFRNRRGSAQAGGQPREIYQPTATIPWASIWLAIVRSTHVVVQRRRPLGLSSTTGRPAKPRTGRGGERLIPPGSSRGASLAKPACALVGGRETAEMPACKSWRDYTNSRGILRPGPVCGKGIGPSSMDRPRAPAAWWFSGLPSSGTSFQRAFSMIRKRLQVARDRTSTPLFDVLDAPIVGSLRPTRIYVKSHAPALNRRAAVHGQLSHMHRRRPLVENISAGCLLDVL